MMKRMFTLILFSLACGLSAQAPVDTSWPAGGEASLDPAIHLDVSLDMAGPSGILEFDYDKSASVRILGAQLVLSMDGGPLFCRELGLDLEAALGVNADLGSVRRDKGRTTIEFTSTLNFIRKQAGLLSVTYAVAGEVRTAYNDRLMESRLLGKWMFDGGDPFPVLFRPNLTVVWGSGPGVPWRIRNGLLTVGEDPLLQQNTVELNGEQVTFRSQGHSLSLVRDFGSDNKTAGKPVSARSPVNKLKAPEDYEYEEVGQRVGGTGDQVLMGFSDPQASKQTISGTKNGLRFIVVSSDPASAIVITKGGKEVGRRATATGFLLGAVLEDETDKVELYGVGFNRESKHFNTWCEMYRTSSVEDAAEQAKSILSAWQGRENKPWVVFVGQDGGFEDLVVQ